MKTTLVFNCEFVGRFSRIFETPFPGPGQHGGFNRLKGVRKQTRKFNRNGVGNVAHSCTRNRSQNGWPTDCLHPRPARLLKPFFVEPMAPGRLASPLRADWPLASVPNWLPPPGKSGPTFPGILALVELGNGAFFLRLNTASTILTFDENPYAKLTRMPPLCGGPGRSNRTHF